jgi:hypothetical protein
MPQQHFIFSSRAIDEGSRQLDEEGRIIRNTLIALASSLKNIGCLALEKVDQEIKRERPYKEHHEIHRSLFYVRSRDKCLCVGITLDDDTQIRAVWVSYGDPHFECRQISNVIFFLNFINPGTAREDCYDPAEAATGWICGILDEFGAEVLSRDSSSATLCGVMEEAAKRADSVKVF